MLIEPGRSLLLMGAPGAGKSEVIRRALAHEGSGAALLAPGNEEATSYLQFTDEDKYFIRGFADSEFLPTLGMWQTDGFKSMLLTLHTIYQRCKWDLGLVENEETKAKFQERFGDQLGELKYKVLGIDTISGVGLLAVNEMQGVTGIIDAPAAQSPDGARYYGGIKNKMEEFMRALDAVRGLGVHLFATSHVMEREQTKTASATHTLKKAWVPAIAGSFRDVVGRAFDLVVFNGVDPDGELMDFDGDIRNNPDNPKYYVQILPEVGKPTKARLQITYDARVPNEWEALKPLIEAAVTARKEG